jgi:hypothetical protein
MAWKGTTGYGRAGQGKQGRAGRAGQVGQDRAWHGMAGQERGVHAGVEVKKQEGQDRAGKRGTCRGRGRETGSYSRANVWIAVSTRVLI